MATAAPADQLRRLQGIPRVKWCQNGKTTDTLDAVDAVFLSSGYGLIPDPWQVDILHCWMGRRRDGKWLHRSCGLAVPRQNGKNGAIEVRELFGLIELGEWILHTAHELKTSRKAFKRLKHFFGEKRDDPNAKFPELNALVSEVRNTNGQEAIVLKDVWRVDDTLVRSIGRPEGDDVELVARGGMIEFATRTGGGARGTTYDLLIIDESQHLAEEDLAAVRPTISSGALGNSQIIYLGTPPDPEKLGAGFGQAFLRIRSQAGTVKTLCWIEYGAPDGPRPDLEDLRLLYACNPSLDVRHANGMHGLDVEVIEGERNDLDPDDYARERLGWWGNPEAKTHRGVIDMDQWRALRVTADDVPTRGLVVVDVAPDQSRTTVALATDGPDGRPLVLVDWHEGTSWPVARVKQLTADLATTLEVCLTPSAHIFSVKLTEAGIEHRKLTPTETGAGCGALQQMVHDGDLAHVGQPILEIAVKNAVTKYVGDVQQWDRRANRNRDAKPVDITPVVAASVALQRWAEQTAKPKTPDGVPVRYTDRPATRRQRGGGQRPTSGGFDPRTSSF